MKKILKKFFTPSRFPLKKSGEGFTLIELMVTIAIFTIISSVVIYQNSKFNSSVLLTNLSYQVALSIRQAQVYGLSSKQFAGQRGIGYGVYFDVQNPKQFIFFADTNNNKIYNSPGERISTTNIGQNNWIFNLCFKLAASFPCTRDIPSVSARIKANIVFQRPNPEPSLKDVGTTSGISQIKIILTPTNDSNTKRCVIVNSAGQISVKSGSSC